MNRYRMALQLADKIREARAALLAREGQDKLADLVFKRLRAQASLMISHQCRYTSDLVVRKLLLDAMRD